MCIWFHSVVTYTTEKRLYAVKTTDKIFVEIFANTEFYLAIQFNKQQF